MLLVLQCQILWQCCAAQLHCLCAVIQPYNLVFLLVSSHIGKCAYSGGKSSSECSVRLVRLGRKRVKTPFKAPWNNSAHSQCTEKKLTSIGNQEEWSRDRRVSANAISKPSFTIKMAIDGIATADGADEGYPVWPGQVSHTDLLHVVAPERSRWRAHCRVGKSTIQSRLWLYKAPISAIPGSRAWHLHREKPPSQNYL